VTVDVSGKALSPEKAGSLAAAVEGRKNKEKVRVTVDTRGNTVSPKSSGDAKDRWKQAGQSVVNEGKKRVTVKTNVENAKFGAMITRMENVILESGIDDEATKTIERARSPTSPTQTVTATPAVMSDAMTAKARAKAKAAQVRKVKQVSPRIAQGMQMALEAQVDQQTANLDVMSLRDELDQVREMASPRPEPEPESAQPATKGTYSGYSS
jgi:hypothetical protein